MTLTLLVLANQDLALLRTGMRAMLAGRDRDRRGRGAQAGPLPRGPADQPRVLIVAVAAGLVVGVSPLLLILGSGLCGALLMRPTDGA